jgi:hypothetical protein
LPPISINSAQVSVSRLVTLNAVTWAFSIWAEVRTWQEAFPPWKQRLLALLLAAYVLLALDVIL